MEEAVAADRVIVLEDGRTVMEGKPSDVFSQVERLKELGLDAPLAAEVAWQLRQQGLDIAADVITDEQLAVTLCP